jgi:hypothetical protein
MSKDGLVDVMEVEIAAPHGKRLMRSGMTEKNAEAFIQMAIARRGVETHFYKAVPSTSESPADERDGGTT